VRTPQSLEAITSLNLKLNAEALLDVSVEPCFCEATALSLIPEFFLQLTRFEVEFSLTVEEGSLEAFDRNPIVCRVQFCFCRELTRPSQEIFSLPYPTCPPSQRRCNSSRSIGFSTTYTKRRMSTSPIMRALPSCVVCARLSCGAARPYAQCGWKGVHVLVATRSWNREG
jgi:hypothetical protein